MKKLTQQEFEDRVMALARSQRIFIESGLTNNISDAFRIYQEVLSETERPLVLTTAKNRNNYGSPKKAWAKQHMVPIIKKEKMICKSCGQPSVTMDDLCPGCPPYAEGNRYSFYCNSCHSTTFGVTING